MSGLPGLARSHILLLTLVGSILMFLGWVFAIVPTFHHLASYWVVVLLGLVAFAIVLIPPGVDIFSRPAATLAAGEKRGLVSMLVSAVPAALLFIVSVAELPLSATLRVVAIVLELVGMVVYLWAWWSYRSVTSQA